MIVAKVRDEVMHLHGFGFSPRAIATALVMFESTVREYLNADPTSK